MNPRIDVTGIRFGRLVAIRPVERPVGKSRSKGTCWECRCDCGVTSIASVCDLRSETVRSCGCLRAESNRYSPIAGCVPDFTGRRFGRLLIIGRNDRVGWSAVCDCGKSCDIRTADLVGGGKNSCGCLGSEYFKKFPAELAGKTRLFHNYKNNAKNRSLTFAIPVEEFFRLVKLPCHYCGSGPSAVINSQSRHEHGAFRYNGLDRVDNSKGYELSNVVPCCKICNIAKHEMDRQEFIDWIERVYSHTFNAIAKTA